MAKRRFLRLGTRVGRPVLLGAAAAFTVGGVALGAGGVASAAPAKAEATATLTYTCDIAGIFKTPLTIEVAATVPSSVAPNASFSITGLQTTTQISTKLLTTIFALYPTTKSISGNVNSFDLNVSGGSPATVNAAASKPKFDVAVKNGQTTPANVVVPATPETVGPITAGASGSVVISLGNVAITTADGSVACAAPKTEPSTAELIVPIASSSGGTTTTTTTAPSTGSHPTPPVATGEPWASEYYWLLLGAAALMGFGLLESAILVRRRRA